MMMLMLVMMILMIVHDDDAGHDDVDADCSIIVIIILEIQLSLAFYFHDIYPTYSTTILCYVSVYKISMHPSVYRSEDDPLLTEDLFATRLGRGRVYIHCKASRN